MSDHGKPDKPGLWRDANEKTVVACMESGELRMRDPDTGMVLSGEWVERAAPFRQAEWKGPKLIGAGFSAMPDTAGCWCDANGTLWLITGGDGGRRAHLPAEGTRPRMGMRAVFRHHREDAPRMGPVGTLRLRADG